MGLGVQLLFRHGSRPMLPEWKLGMNFAIYHFYRTAVRDGSEDKVEDFVPDPDDSLQ